MRFVVMAFDGDEPDAPARRAQTRPRHLEGMRPLAEDGRLLLAGAILGAEGDPVGSMLVFDVEDRAAVDAIVTGDPYTAAGVWQRVEIWPFTPAMGAWLPPS